MARQPPTPPLSDPSHTQAVSPARDSSHWSTMPHPSKTLGHGYYRWWEHMVWVVWQAKSWQKSPEASADAAIAQTSKWWHNCRCCLDATCFPVMTAMPFPWEAGGKTEPSLVPIDKHTWAWTHTHTRKRACMGTLDRVSPVFWRPLSSTLHGRNPAGKNYFILPWQSSDISGPLRQQEVTPAFHQTHSQRKDGDLLATKRWDQSPLVSLATSGTPRSQKLWPQIAQIHPYQTQSVS